LAFHSTNWPGKSARSCRCFFHRRIIRSISRPHCSLQPRWVRLSCSWIHRAGISASRAFPWVLSPRNFSRTHPRCVPRRFMNRRDRRGFPGARFTANILRERQVETLRLCARVSRRAEGNTSGDHAKCAGPPVHPESRGCSSRRPRRWRCPRACLRES
jgi:hypothetical protein